MIKLNKDQAKNVRNRIIDEWDAGESYCYPLNDFNRNDFICFPQDFFLKDFGLNQLRKTLEKLGLESCYRLDEYLKHNEDYKINLNDIVAYNGLEKYYCDNSNSWIIYFSHENTVTFGGESLIKAIKNDWKNWKIVAFKWHYKENQAIDGMIEVLTTIKEKIDSNTNLNYCGFDTIKELEDSIDFDLTNLRFENTEYFEDIKNRFLPTVDFQELSIDNGWGDEYIILANKFDACYEKWEKYNLKQINKPSFLSKIISLIKK